MKTRHKPFLYLPIEIKVRELDAKLLFAYYAAKQGYRIIIGEHKMVELAAEHYPPGIFFSKGYPNQFRKRIITTTVKHHHKVVELDEEGLIIHDPSDYLNNRMQADMLQLVSQEYCWGPSQQKLITDAVHHEKDKCFITGNPRFDLLTRKFRSLYEDDANQLTNRYGPFILINTRFSLYNSIYGRKTTNDHEFYIKNLYEHFIAMTHQIAKKLPNTNIVIRPHPSENLTSYKEEFASQQNIHIVHAGNIINWLLAAKVIIHHGCTSSIEAFLLEKPIISYTPITSKQFDVSLPNTLGINAEDIDEVIELLNDRTKLHQNNTQRNKRMKELDQYYLSPSKHYAYETILSLLKLLNHPRPTKMPPVRRTLYRKERKAVKRFFPFLHLKEIEIFFQKLDTIEGEHTHFRIRSLGRNVFCVETSD